MTRNYKLRCEMTLDELEAARAKDREIYYRRRANKAWVRLKRARDRAQQARRYQDPAIAMAISIEAKAKRADMKHNHPEAYQQALAEGRARGKERYHRRKKDPDAMPPVGRPRIDD